MVAGEFAQAPSRRRARGYLLGLLSHSERKNGWTIAEFAGDAGPEGMQRLLNFYAWDEGKVRDALRRYVVAAFGHPAGVLVADETGFLKQGRMSAGVQRQYSGTAGRVENCQLGVFLAYAAPDGSRALIDRELYLPESWVDDRDRCREAGIGDDVGFATKPELARTMLERAVAAGVPFSWFTADEAYGQNPGLRDWLEEQRIAYVMAVPFSELCATAAGKIRADGLAARVPVGGWQVLILRRRVEGPRLYNWALISLAAPGHLLVRRALAPNAKGELELAFFLCSAPPGTTLPELVAVRRQVGDRGLLRRGQERDRARPLPGPPLPRLVPPHHLVHAGPRVPRRHRGHGKPRRRPAASRHRQKGDPGPVDSHSARAEHIAHRD
jgi:hypothetical protein